MALPPTYKARLKEKIILTPHVRDFLIELEEPGTIDFKAGQFVLVKTKHPQTGELISRAYSIASAPSETHVVRLNLEIVPQGKLTPLMEQWEVGAPIELQGPFGHFVVKSLPEKKTLLFVATGVGVAPFRSMIEDLLSKGDSREFHLYFGVRSQEDIFYREVFEALASQHPNFHFTLTLSRPQESGGWTGAYGRVTALLPDASFDPSTTDAYLCGGKPMIDDVKKILLQKGFPPAQIFFEPFFV